VKDFAIQRLGLEHLRVDEVEPRLAGIVLTGEAIATVGEPDDWGDMVEIPRSLRGNEVAYLLRQKKLKDGTMVVRASLRSNPPYRIGDIALAFGGGGHHQAAGATIPGRIEEVLPDLLVRLRGALQVQGTASGH
jgi:bifunctional oligoribonuclease and PAP phosphatase NrnA